MHWISPVKSSWTFLLMHVLFLESIVLLLGTLVNGKLVGKAWEYNVHSPHFQMGIWRLKEAEMRFKLMWVIFPKHLMCIFEFVAYASSKSRPRVSIVWPRNSILLGFWSDSPGRLVHRLYGHALDSCLEPVMLLLSPHSLCPGGLAWRQQQQQQQLRGCRLWGSCRQQDGQTLTNHLPWPNPFLCVRHCLPAGPREMPSQPVPPSPKG